MTHSFHESANTTDPGVPSSKGAHTPTPWKNDKATTAELFTLEDDYVTRADFWFRAGLGTLVQTPDGREWTVVYSNLDGYGVVAGDHPHFINADNSDLPMPTHMLRDFYERKCDDPVEFLGEIVRYIRHVKPDRSVENYITNLEPAS